MGGWMKEERAAGMWEGMWCSYHNSWNVSDRDVLNQWFSRWGPRPIAHALRENLLEMQIWAPRPRSIESETLGVGPSTLCFNKSSRWFRPRLKFENHGGGPVSFYRWENQDEELGNDLSELTHSVCDTAGSPELQPLPLPPNQPASLHLAISLCNQKEPCICQTISKSWDWISTPVRFLISLGVFQNLEKKKMWLRVVSARLWAVERSQAIALLLTGGFLGRSCNVIAPCDGPGPPLSLAIMHVTHDLVSCFRGRECMNGGWCWPRGEARDFGLDQISTVIMLFLLISSFGYKFLLKCILHIPFQSYSYACFCLFSSAVNHAGYTIKECFLSPCH